MIVVVRLTLLLIFFLLSVEVESWYPSFISVLKDVQRKPSQQSFKVLEYDQRFYRRSHLFAGVGFAARNIDDLPDDLKHLYREFLVVSQGQDSINFKSLLEWEEIQALLSDDLISMKELKVLWKQAADPKTDSIGIKEFLALNRALDDMFEDAQDDPDMEIEDDGGDFDAEYVQVNPWDLSITVDDLGFESEFVSYLEAFFLENAEDDKSAQRATAYDKFLSFAKFANWKDIKDILIEGRADDTCLKEVWEEALKYKQNIAEIEGGTSGQNSIVLDSNINFDIFLRMNYRLNEMLDDIQGALDMLTDDELESYYSDEFERLVSSQYPDFLSYDQLLLWEDVQHILQSNGLRRTELEDIWYALPKKTFNKSEEGIDKQTFILLNNEISRRISEVEFVEE
eukprot:gene5014-7001_t